MIYKLMPVADINNLLEKVYNEVGFLTVKFPKSDKLFIYDGKVLSGDRIALYLQNNKHLVQTSARELLVEMNYHTYELHQLIDDADYQLALELLEYYLNQTLPKEGLRFVYLLRLIIEDYERQHYPIAVFSTVDFIDHLLEERGQTWLDVSIALGYGREVNPDFIRSMIDDDLCGYKAIIKLSHFFKLPVQAFIIGGYNA